MNKIVLITGATSGIGKACAYAFAQKGFDIIITGRRKERLDTLQKELEEKHAIKCLSLCFDVQIKEQVNNAFDQLPQNWKSIDILINNAGLALGRDSFEDAKMEDWETMIDTNIKGLLYCSKAIIPIMIENKKGHIVNIGSTAGKEVYANGNVYCATKSAVDAISKAQRIDLLKYGIKVTAIHPGATETEFSIIRLKGNESAASAVYDGMQPLKGDDVANIILFATTLPNHVCINDLVVTCTQQANSFYTFK